MASFQCKISACSTLDQVNGLYNLMAGLRTSFVSSKLVKLIKYLVLVLFIFVMVSINFYVLNSFLTKKTLTMNGEREEETTRLIWSRASHLNAAPFLQRKRPSTPRILPKMSSNLDLATIRLNIFNSSCPKRLEIMQYGIVVFRYIAIRPKLGHSRALEAFLEEPSAEDELFLLSKGFFTLYCHGDVDRVEEKLLKADEDYTLITWKIAFEAVNPWQFLRLGGHPSVQAGHYLAIQRNEFANVYWTIVDLLDIFITSQSLGIEPDKLNIILMDAHPKTSLDPFWTVLFQRLIKLTDPIFVESNCVLFENLLWRYPPAKSPLLDSSLNSLKHIQPFRSFVLRRFGISSGTHFRKCNQLNLNILFILRRDYKSHPRNLAGIIDRKIANEEDVLREIKSSFPDANITPVQLDLLTLKAQLEIVAKTDILFGMHGAAHAFSIFMPPGGAVVEMFHHNSNTYNWHMNKIATLSDHSYINWENTDMRAVDTLRKSIVIPRGVSYRLLRMAIDSICPNSN